MRKSCASCGAEFEAKRSAAKYCGDRCRQRGHRRPEQARTAEILPLPAGPASEPAPGVGGKLAEATAAELEEAGRLNTAIGQAALALAARIDAGIRETGSALAALVREHRAALGEALSGAKAAADPLDELRARRERKHDAG